MENQIENLIIKYQKRIKTAEDILKGEDFTDPYTPAYYYYTELTKSIILYTYIINDLKNILALEREMRLNAGYENDEN